MDERKHWEARQERNIAARSERSVVVRPEKTVMRIDNDPENRISKATDNVKRNPWIAVSIVLGIAVIILLYMVMKGGITGNVIKGEDAGTSLVAYLN